MLRQFSGRDGADAIEALIRLHDGEVPEALPHPTYPAGVFWEKTDAQANGKGYGLSHVIYDRPGDTPDHTEGYRIARLLPEIYPKIKADPKLSRPERVVLTRRPRCRGRTDLEQASKDLAGIGLQI